MTELRVEGPFPDSESGLLAVTQGWVTAYNAEDAAGTAAFFAEDAVFYPPNAPMARGVDEIAELMRQVFALGSLDFSLTPIASVRSGETAYQTVAYSQTITPNTGPTIEDRGEAIIIMRRVGDDEWRIVHDMYNSDLPAAAA
jgi:uncharacterized protein (TIGR02246 family)